MPFRRLTHPFTQAIGFTPPRKVFVIVQQDSPLSRKHLPHPEQPLFDRRIHTLCFHHAFPVPLGRGFPKTYNKT